MSRRPQSIARIRLARSLPRLLAWPAIVVLTGALAIGSWLVGSFGDGAGGVVFAGLGAVLVLIGIVSAVLLFSIRLEVLEASIRLRWLGGERVYHLTPGPVTRVRLRGPDASRLRPRVGFAGWSIGSARLRDEEEIHVVRLAPTPTAILVPTDQGRLGIAPADEDQLLEALTHAARARQRRDDLAAAPPPEPPVAPAAEVATVAGEPGVADAAAAPPEPVDAPVEVAPRLMTGIERALLEERLARERAEAEAAARAAAEAAEAEAAAAAAAAAEAEARPERGERRRRARAVIEAWRPSLAFALLPLLGAGAAWGVGALTGRTPDPQSDVGRLTALALVLAGPATSVGALMARTWWPRLVAVVVLGGLIGAAFVARALLG